MDKLKIVDQSKFVEVKEDLKGKVKLQKVEWTFSKGKSVCDKCFYDNMWLLRKDKLVRPNPCVRCATDKEGKQYYFKRVYEYGDLVQTKDNSIYMVIDNSKESSSTYCNGCCFDTDIIPDFMSCSEYSLMLGLPNCNQDGYKFKHVLIVDNKYRNNIPEHETSSESFQKWLNKLNIEKGYIDFKQCIKCKLGVHKTTAPELCTMYGCKRK